ncbi:MAG: hypothetical protein QF442_00220 [Candidatus Peribacteraceae bacterium]|jgi:Trp operon repressor|nr:hypothetical protein [Candidatus Peribacteraceae bacterium]
MQVPRVLSGRRKIASEPKRESSQELRRLQALVEAGDNDAVDKAVDELIRNKSELVDLLLEKKEKYIRHSGMAPVFKAIGCGVSRYNSSTEIQEMLNRSAATIARANAVLDAANPRAKNAINSEKEE